MSHYYGFEDVWLDKSKYDSAERLHYEEQAKPKGLYIIRSLTKIRAKLLPILDIWELAIIGLFVHLIMISAVFDIYYVSPIYQGMAPHKAKDVALAKRVVFILGDGLRAASLFQQDRGQKTPFLTDRIKSSASSWGVSNAKAPTESRPGHIALFGGFNEDPSAITTIWKNNPVEFDSVINQSRKSFIWGNKAEVDLFINDKLKNTYTNNYNMRITPAELDDLVVSGMIDFVQQHQKPICTDICAPGNIFIVLLTGLRNDCYSSESIFRDCNNTLKNADNDVKTLVTNLDKIFNDDKTAYIFTATYGKNIYGGHGGGSDLETKVPVIAWGSGIRKRNNSEDIKQIDTAPLISALIGINFPINSMGMVPVNYLNASLPEIAEIIYANTLQFSEQFQAKRLHFKRNTLSWLSRSFAKLPEYEFLRLMRRLNTLSVTKKYKQLIAECQDAINLMKDGIQYYYRYHQIQLLSFVTVGFIGWILYLITSIQDFNTVEYDRCKQDSLECTRTLRNIYGEVLALLLIVCTTPFAMWLPAKNYMYMVFPIFTWCMVLGNYKNGLVTVAYISMFNWKDLMITILTYVYELQLLILSFVHTLFLTLLFANLAFLEALNKNYRYSPWMFGIFGLGLCPLLTFLKPFTVMCQIVALSMWAFYGYVLYINKPNSNDKRILTYQFIVLFIAFGNTLLVGVLAKYDVTLYYNRSLSWLILGTTLVCPFLMSRNLQSRLISCSIALVTPYTLMSVGYESLFMFFFAQQMLGWLPTEHKYIRIKNPECPSLKLYDTVKITHEAHTDTHNLKLCFYLLAYLTLSYFGPGNSASINIFDPNWTRCFISETNISRLIWPLISLKLTIPLLIVMFAFYGIMLINEAQVRNTFLMILLFSDVMVLQFLYLIKNEGSWLQMGTSLIRFLIVNVTTIVVLLLYGVSLFLTTKSLPVFTAVRMVKSLRTQQEA